MIEFVQATKDDVLSIYPQTAQWDSYEFGRSVFEKDLVPLADRAIAIREDGWCIGAYGLIVLWPGVARAWGMFSTQLLKNHGSVLALHIVKDLRRAEKVGVRRIEATTATNHMEARAFLRWLGFQAEGLMRAYSPDGADAYLFAKVSNVV